MAPKRPPRPERNRGAQSRSVSDFFAGIEQFPEVQLLIRHLDPEDKEAKDKFLKMVTFLAETTKTPIATISETLLSNMPDTFVNGTTFRMLSIAFGFYDGAGARKAGDVPPFSARMMSTGGPIKIVVKSPIHEKKNFTWMQHSIAGTFLTQRCRVMVWRKTTNSRISLGSSTCTASSKKWKLTLSSRMPPLLTSHVRCHGWEPLWST